MDEILERLEKLEQENQYFRERLHNLEEHVSEYPNLKILADDIQQWVLEEYSPVVQQWFFEEVAPKIQDWVTGPYSDLLQEWIERYVTEKINTKEQ